MTWYGAYHNTIGIVSFSWSWQQSVHILYFDSSHCQAFDFVTNQDVKHSIFWEKQVSIHYFSLPLFVCGFIIRVQSFIAFEITTDQQKNQSNHEFANGTRTDKMPIEWKEWLTLNRFFLFWLERLQKWKEVGRVHLSTPYHLDQTLDIGIPLCLSFVFAFRQMSNLMFDFVLCGTNENKRWLGHGASWPHKIYIYSIEIERWTIDGV